MAKKQLNDREVSAIIAQFIRDSVGFRGESSLVNERLKALRTYYSEPYGDERKGRSSFVTSDARDTVQWMLPQLIDTFMSAEHIVEFKPRGPEDEAIARQATDYVNFIFWEDNPGYETLRTTFMDALISKDGYIKYWWDDDEQTKKMRFEGLDREQVAAFEEEDNKNIIEKEEYPDFIVDPLTGETMEVMLYNITVEETGPTDRVRLESVAPEDLLFDRQASDWDDIRFIAQKCRVMRGDLLERGYPKDKVMRLPRYAFEEYDIEKERRYYYNDITNYYDYTGVQDATEVVLLYECYLYMDYDGDGIPELRKIITSYEDSSMIFENEEVDEMPFAKFGAFPQPHVWSSRSLVDETMDIQRINTTLTRNILDGLYKTTAPRYRISSNDKTALLDIMRDVPGGLVRALNDTRIEPLPKDQIQPQYFDVVQNMIPTMIEKRTGVTENNQGLDPEQVNRTAYGTSKIMQAGQQRQKMMAREFAETGMQRLAKGVYGLVVKHQDRARIVRLNNKWVEIDPTKWPDNFDTRIAIGIGTGDKEKQFQDLNLVLTQQKEAFQNGMATYENIFNTMTRMLGLMGYKNPAEFLMLPEQYEQMQAQQAQQQPPQDPKAMAAMAKVQLEQGKLQLDQQKAMTEAQLKQEELAIKAQETQADTAQKMTEAEANTVETRAKAQGEMIKSLNTMSGAQINATTEVAKNIVEIVAKVVRGEIPRETGASTLQMTYGMSPEQVEFVMANAGSLVAPDTIAIDTPIDGNP